MSISLICACKNRLGALSVSLSSWLKFNQIQEIIIVDWDSDEPISHLANLDSRIKIITVKNKKYFNQPQPLNLAASLATGDYILKVDTDYIFNPYFNFIEAYKPEENSFTSGKHNYESPEFYSEEHGYYMLDKTKMTDEELHTYYDSYSPYFRYLTGLLFIKKEYFNKVGGYNENLGKCYAYEDDEIFQRLRLLGLKENKLNCDHHLIHIPHPDKKRTENFQGFSEEKEYEDMIRANLSNYYSGDDVQWQLEYVLAKKHIELNKELIGKITDYYVHPKTNWEIQQLDNQNYIAKEKMNKLKNFPKSYYISLEESQDRQETLEKAFKEYNVYPKKILSKRFSECDDIVTGKYVHQLNDGTKGCCVSHLKAIQEWYQTCNDEYAFFCEDDLSLETIDYWDFTWENFIKELPEDWECVQLLTIRCDFEDIELRERYWDDWGATAYILKRSYAKKIVDTYIKDSYHLEVPNQDVMPLIENILFTSLGKVYTIPLFVENINFSSTFVGNDNDVNEGQKNNHTKSYDSVMSLWKDDSETIINDNSNETPFMKTELEELLEEYALDPENAVYNFNLGVWYEHQGHTAPALSYYLRCAERTDNEDFAYEALIRGSYCYDKQGTRDGSAKSMLQQALILLPKRPEAYFLLSRFSEKREWWQDCYIYADQALKFCEFEQKDLFTNVEYPGKYGLLFEKAISAWWWGKVEESKNLFTEILEYENVERSYLEAVKNNLKMFNDSSLEETIKNILPEEDQEFKFKEDFDWGDLTYEDIITIDREIIHEKCYRYWRDVKENDVVMDIGSSVGPFICSILENKPSKVYCVEPSKTLIKTLAKNCAEYLLEYSHNPLVYINKGIVSNPGDSINIFGTNKEFAGITFKDAIDTYSIDKINFLKIDCEGGEYNIFKEENMNFLLNKVEFIAMEVHLNYENCREKFKEFRDKYLTQFKDYRVMSCTRQQISWGNSIDIKDRIFDNQFIDEYTCEFMIYIYNQFDDSSELDTSQFDWGDTIPEYVQLFSNENFVERTYEKHHQVKSGDIVLDVGANCGSFTYSILNKNPKHVYCIEPSDTLIHSLRKNVGNGPVTIINKGIADEECDASPSNEKGVFIYHNDGTTYSTTTFENIIKENNITQIDFLKFDCEGGEYSIFTKENYEFIKNNVKHFAGEWHINDHENSVERFIEFRNLYLQDYKEIHIYQRDGRDISKEIFDDQYLYDFKEYWKDTYLGQFLVYVTY